MSRLQTLKVLIKERLAAAVEDIVGHMERTISEYEEEMESRLRQLLLLESEPVKKLRRTVFCADVQQPVVIKEEQQEWSSSLDLQHPEQLHIKEEQYDLQSSQEAEQLQGLHEDHITTFPFTAIPGRSEDGEEKPQSSQLHHRQTEENREAEAPPSNSSQHIKTENDGEDCGGSEPFRILESGFKCLSGSEAVTGGSGDEWKPQTDLNTMKTDVPVNDMGHNNSNKSFSCLKCGKRFGKKHHLQAHMMCHTGEKPFSCSLCGKRFSLKGNLTQHLTVHTKEKPCICPVCGERFAQQGNLTQHMTVHTREKLLVRD